MTRWLLGGWLTLLLLCPSLALAGLATNLELVAAAEAVDNLEYSGSVAVPINGQAGEMLGYTFKSAGTVVPKPAGTLMVFAGLVDPNPTPGVAALTTADRDEVLCQIPVSVVDWQVDANGGSAYLAIPPCPFPSGRTNLFLVWFHQDAVALDGTTHVLKVTVQWGTP